MDTREIANQYRISQWSQMFAERIAGESIDEFCERRGITRTQYFYWQCKLRKTACTELAVQSESLAPEG